MTQSQYIIARKLSIVESGRTLGNISDACRKMGVSRQHYYDIKRAVEEEDLEGLLEKSLAVVAIRVYSWPSGKTVTGYYAASVSSISFSKTCF